MNDIEKTRESVGDGHHKNSARKGKSGRMAPATRGETLVKGVLMGFIISGVTHASKNITRVLFRHPLVLLSSGAVTGYLTHKYRKEIVAIGTQTAMESKHFVLRQKENLLDLVAESREYAGERDKSK
ncbi:hypothetical protein QZJ86_08445 [Methylomonas montana]|uniref:hypothetical protein n=1 Tax=Methylomonas montana TaxID=3058963 RepID=UPI0026596A80|nr:hypothetical protein [Methylomonas montana]WKJ92156.1 hypothetical protein QZJ86_08445 [Methylomonas montana]